MPPRSSHTKAVDRFFASLAASDPSPTPPDPGPRPGDPDETRLRMDLRYKLHDVFQSDTTGAWRWIGEVTGRGGVVPPVYLSRVEIEAVIVALEARRARVATA